MKKRLFSKISKIVLSATLGTTLLVGCSTGSEANNEPTNDSLEITDVTEVTDDVVEVTDDLEIVKLVVGATVKPHAEILNFIKDDLLAEGIDLEITEFSDYALINPSTEDGSLDANFFQHTPFLDDFNATNDGHLISAGSVHLEPLGIYSNKIDSLETITEGGKVGIPNDPSNGARALKLLEDNGIISIDPEKSENLTVQDIIENSLNIEVIELDAAQLPRSLDEFEIAVINTNFAIEADLNPMEDALAIESSDSPYANILAIREEDKDNEALQKLYSALTTDKVRDFIIENYDGSIVPTF